MMDLLGLLGWTASAVTGQVAALVKWVVGGFGVLYGNDAMLSGFMGGALKAIWGVFTGLWKWLDSIYKWINSHIIQQLRDLINRIHDRLQKIFGPLLAQLRKEIALYRQLWLQYVKPIYDFLQRIRRVLVVFRLLGFKWAIALDNRIQGIENQLTAAFMGVLQNLNTLADWVNFIIDPFGLFQPFPLLGSVLRSGKEILTALSAAVNDPLFVAGKDHYSTPDDYYSAAAFNARMQARAGGALLPDDQQILDSINLAQTELGYTA